jgi:hypothetical protein
MDPRRRWVHLPYDCQPASDTQSIHPILCNAIVSVTAVLAVLVLRAARQRGKVNGRLTTVNAHCVQSP